MLEESIVVNFNQFLKTYVVNRLVYLRLVFVNSTVCVEKYDALFLAKIFGALSFSCRL